MKFLRAHDQIQSNLYGKLFRAIGDIFGNLNRHRTLSLISFDGHFEEKEKQVNIQVEQLIEQYQECLKSRSMIKAQKVDFNDIMGEVDQVLKSIVDS